MNFLTSKLADLLSIEAHTDEAYLDTDTIRFAPSGIAIARIHPCWCEGNSHVGFFVDHAGNWQVTEICNSPIAAVRAAEQKSPAFVG